MNNNRTKVITIAALVIAVIALSIGFAAFASTLNISTGASVTPTNTFSVKFASSVTGANGEFTQFSVTPTVAVTSTSDNGAIAGTPEIDNTNNPTIGNLSASFTRPGQSVTYTFYVVNDGNYDAYLTNLVFNNATGASSFKDCVSDSLSSNPATQSLVDSVCNNITFTMSVGNDSNITSSTRLNNHLLTRNHYETVIVTIAYQGEAYADGAFKVNFGDIDLNYRTIDEVEEAPTPTPATSDVVFDDLSPNAEQLAIIQDDGEYEIASTNNGSITITLNYSNDIKYISYSRSGLELYWFIDEGDASAFNLMRHTNVEPDVWIDGDNWIEYTGPCPISYSTFDGGTISDSDYLDRVINSFNN